MLDLAERIDARTKAHQIVESLLHGVARQLNGRDLDDLFADHRVEVDYVRETIGDRVVLFDLWPDCGISFVELG